MCANTDLDATNLKVSGYFPDTDTFGFLSNSATCTLHRNFVMLCSYALHVCFQEGLLDRQDFIQWLLELLEKEKIKDDTVLKLVIAQILRVSSTHLTNQKNHFYLIYYLLQRGCVVSTVCFFVC